MTDYIRKPRVRQQGPLQGDSKSVLRVILGLSNSGQDKDLNVELDLAYITDQVIVMGYPATGIEGLYRNKREDARRFLETRHLNQFWVLNFCPLSENSYPAALFSGRVSRYPFPDHHAPPLTYLPLVAREMHEWLKDDPERVAVLHCKAGKGRSGTMACAYLLSLDGPLAPPRLRRSYTAKEWAMHRAEAYMDAMPKDSDDAPNLIVDPVSEETSTAGTETVSDAPAVHSPIPLQSTSSSAPGSRASSAPSVTPAALQNVLDLHTARRMRTPDAAKMRSKDSRSVAEPGSVDEARNSNVTSAVLLPKNGVSIPSQRRWLLYWSLLLEGGGPSGFWGLPQPASDNDKPMPPSKPGRPALVHIDALRVRMRPPRSVTAGLVRAANALLSVDAIAGTGAGAGMSADTMWASLARYDDRMVDALERWEQRTRDPAHLGRYASGEEGATVRMFDDEGWDGTKMVRRFARLGAGSAPIQEHNDTQTALYTLTPLERTPWASARRMSKPSSAQTSEVNITQPEIGSSSAPVIVDARRELRVKLYTGQIFMGWFWFIPAFHMPAPPDAAPSSPAPPTVFAMTRADLDFPLGLGEGIVDVEVVMRWCTHTENEQPTQQAPERGSDVGESGLGSKLGKLAVD